MMSTAQQWAGGVTGVQAYITKCKSYGLLSIGCGRLPEDCASTWGENECINMPQDWGCTDIGREDLNWGDISSVFIITQNLHSHDNTLAGHPL